MAIVVYCPAGEKVLVHKHEGHLQARIVYYLMNIHITPRTIYLTRVSTQSRGVLPPSVRRAAVYLY